MPLMIPDHSIVVVRDGEQVTAQPNKAFNFTAEEVAEVLKMVPGSLRKPINESSDIEGDDVERNKAPSLSEAERQAEALRQQQADDQLVADAQKQAESSNQLALPGSKGGKPGKNALASDSATDEV